MAGAKKRRQKYQNKTKAQLIEELKALERELARQKRGGDGAANPLLESKEFFQTFFDHSPMALFVRDLKGRFLFVNRAYEEWYGVDRKDLLGKTPTKIFNRKTAKRVIGFDREVLESGTRIEMETESILADGSTRNQRVIKFPLLGGEGETIGVCGILTDLSEQLRAEKEILEKEERWRGAVESLQEGFALYDAEDRLVAFNEKYRRMRPEAQEIMERGGTFEDVTRANLKYEIIPEAAGREEAFIKERLRQHKNPKGPIIRHFSDGTWSRIEEVKTPDGGTVITFIDITELKQAEEALRKNEALLKAVVNYSPTKIHIKDVEGRYTLINKEAEKLFGITDEEGRGKTSYDLFPKDVADAFMAHDKAVIESGQATVEEEEFTLEDGVHTFLTVKFPIYDLDGVAGVGAMGTDITERKQIEAELERQKNLFESVFRDVPDAMVLADAERNVIMCNPAVTRTFGYEVDELQGKNTVIFYSSPSLYEKQGRLRYHMSAEEQLEPYVVDYKRKNGEIFPGETVGAPMRDRDGNVFGFIAVIRDITDRVQAEEALRDSELRFRSLVESTSVIAWELDLKTWCFTYVSPHAVNLLGYSLEDWKKKNFWVDHLHPDDRDEAIQFCEAATKRGEDHDFEYRMIAADGRVIWFRDIVTVNKDAEGRPSSLQGYFIDISEIKKTEDALRESEQRFKDVAESTSDWIWEMGPDLCFTYFSERYAEVTGFPIEDRIGTSRLDHSPDNYTEDELEQWNAHIADLKAKRPFKNFEYATTATPRGLRYVSVSGRPVFGKDGEFLGYRGTGTDITERKMADEALRQSQARLANILDNSPAPIYFKDTEGRFLVANRQYQKIYKVDFEDIRGKTSKEIFGDETGGKFHDHDREVLESRKMIEREENFLGKTYLTLKFPIIDPSGELLGLGGIETDVSEIKKVERELHAAKEQAEFANRAKTEFLANMSHELRTPLNSILGFSEVLMIETFGPLGSDKYKEYAADIHSSGTHLLDLISEVLDLSKLETGQLKLIESDIDVTETVNACVRMVEGHSDEEMASISARFENGLPLLRADERRFKQILLNLIGNAVKFTPPEGGVTVATRICKRGEFIIEVADNGIGIAPEDLRKVLEPFGQADDILTRNHDGSGLGLYLAKSFTELHGGSLDIESDLGKGTTVTLRFPAERTIRAE